ncbi:MAG: ADP-ribosylglycohydrolase family protein [Sutterella wadsworthensis]
MKTLGRWSFRDWRKFSMSHLLQAVVGAAVGDALGVPYEGKERDTYVCENMHPLGWHEKPVGFWSDDTAMILAELDSLRERQGYDAEDVMMKFDRWLHEGPTPPTARPTAGVARRPGPSRAIAAARRRHLAAAATFSTTAQAHSCACFPMRFSTAPTASRSSMRLVRSRTATRSASSSAVSTRATSTSSFRGTSPPRRLKRSLRTTSSRFRTTTSRSCSSCRTSRASPCRTPASSPTSSWRPLVPHQLRQLRRCRPQGRQSGR